MCFVSLLLSMAIGMRLECIMVDVLHTVDLGVTLHILGNIFWIFVMARNVLGGANQDERAKRLWNDMQSWYRKNKHARKLQAAVTKER